MRHHIYFLGLQVRLFFVTDIHRHCLIAIHAISQELRGYIHFKVQKMLSSPAFPEVSRTATGAIHTINNHRLRRSNHQKGNCFFAVYENFCCYDDFPDQQKKREEAFGQMSMLGHIAEPFQHCRQLYLLKCKSKHHIDRDGLDKIFDISGTLSLKTTKYCFTICCAT